MMAHTSGRAYDGQGRDKSEIPVMINRLDSPLRGTAKRSS